MKILLLYASKYGCTEDCANYLKSKLNKEVNIASLKKFSMIDLQQFDWIIIGGSIYVGKIQKEVKLFCEQNIQKLLTKNIVLFMCCTTPEQVNNFFKSNFSPELLKHAKEKVNFGGELRQHKMRFFDKKITAMISKLEPKKVEILYSNIDQLAMSINAN